MAEHGFELTIRGKLTDARLDALIEAGCDDATFSAKDDLTFAAWYVACPHVPRPRWSLAAGHGTWPHAGLAQDA